MAVWMHKELYAAAVSGNTDKLNNLLKRDLHVLNEATPAGNTALHIAAYHGRVEFVKMLVEISRGHLETDFVSKINSQGNTALHEAVSGGYTEIADILLKEYSGLASVFNKAGETPLFIASMAGHTETVEKLLDVSGMAPLEQQYQRQSDGQTLLHCAVFNKHRGVIKKLLEHKHDLISQADNLGRTALHVVASIPPIREVVPPFHPWLYATHVKEIVHITTDLLEKDSSLCYRVDKKKQTALHIAVKEGNVEVVRLMLKYAEDCLELADMEGRNALHLAVFNAEHIFNKNSVAFQPILYSLMPMSRRLINDRDNEGKTALDMAVDNMDKDEPLFYGLKKFLEANGALRNAKMPCDLKTTRTEAPKEETSEWWRVELISLNAVLIATVSFTAPFDLLGGLNDSEPGPTHHQVFDFFMFYVFVISDTIAFGASIASAMGLLFVVLVRQKEASRGMIQTGFFAVMLSLLSLMITFGSAIYLFIAPKYFGLVLFVWFMLAIVLLALRVKTLRSKLYVFTENKYVIIFIIEDTLGVIISSIGWVVDIIRFLCWWGIRHPTIQWAKKNWVSVEE